MPGRCFILHQLFGVERKHHVMVRNKVANLTIESECRYIHKQDLFIALIKDTVAFIDHSLRHPPWPWQITIYPRNFDDSVCF